MSFPYSLRISILESGEYWRNHFLHFGVIGAIVCAHVQYNVISPKLIWLLREDISSCMVLTIDSVKLSSNRRLLKLNFKRFYELGRFKYNVEYHGIPRNEVIHLRY